MLLSIINRTPNATDLGYLLHKHPQHVHDVKLGYGNAKVFYTKAEDHALGWTPGSLEGP